MSCRSFSLEPHPAARSLPEVKITGSIERRFNRLTVSYVLWARMEDISIPPRDGCALRRTGLWESTCFEFFVAPLDDPRYWEFNLSPSGHWNVFQFDGYRQGMEEEPSIESLVVATRTLPGSFHATVDLDLGKIIPDTRTLQVAVSTVLQHKDGQMSFWALTHCGSRPDFHHREGFVIVI